jgi:N-acetylglucosamine kinase-like BadF-type ATPase
MHERKNCELVAVRKHTMRSWTVPRREAPLILNADWRGLLYALSMRYVLGFDGGGTKTECVLMDETGAVLARALAGASNAINVGTPASAAALAAAGSKALRSAAKPSSDVAYIVAGISGAGEPAVRAEIQANLKPAFPKASIAVTSDLVLTLAATGEIPSVVVIAGTGSAVLGRTSPLKLARAGGFGPIIGDPGSANDIGRKTVARCFQRFLNKEKFLLTDEICRTFDCTWPQFVDLAREQPTVILPKIFPIVARAAESGDLSARAIITIAGFDLLEQVQEVVRQLHLQSKDFFLAKTGGVFDGSLLLNEHFDNLVRQSLPKVRIGPLPRPVAESAAQLARDALTSPLQIPES